MNFAIVPRTTEAGGPGTRWRMPPLHPITRGSGTPFRPRLRRTARLLAASVFFMAGSLAGPGFAQEMEPRAYSSSPVGANFLAVAVGNTRGAILFDPTVPITDAQADLNLGSIGYARSFGLAGRQGLVAGGFSYARGDLEGKVSEEERRTGRSGLADMRLRVSLNLMGPGAMTREQFATAPRKTIVGVSLTVQPPTGQYDETRLINIGTNRWAFKPEVGVSRAIGKWTVEGAAGVWLYTANNQYYRNSVRTQVPLGSLQAHVVRLLPHRTWFAADWTLYTGGRSAINGRDLPNYQGNTRLGATLGISLRPRHAVKISYFRGAITRVGTDVSSIGISYNVIWQKGR